MLCVGVSGMSPAMGDRACSSACDTQSLGGLSAVCCRVQNKTDKPAASALANKPRRSKRNITLVPLPAGQKQVKVWPGLSGLVSVGWRVWRVWCGWCSGACSVLAVVWCLQESPACSAFYGISAFVLLVLPPTLALYPSHARTPPMSDRPGCCCCNFWNSGVWLFHFPFVPSFSCWGWDFGVADDCPAICCHTSGCPVVHGQVSQCHCLWLLRVHAHSARCQNNRRHCFRHFQCFSPCSRKGEGIQYHIFCCCLPMAIRSLCQGHSCLFPGSC